MTPEDFVRVKEILLTSAALGEGERKAYLDQACGGDSALRTEVESLLAHRDIPTGQLRPDGLMALAEAISLSGAEARAGTGGRVRLPERIGPYRVLGILGEGGMGIVYRAEQTEPVRREVALKLIRAGAYSGSVLARFEAERQTLALMDHPGIARLFDAGADGDGRPYFVMELIRGVPLTDYARERQLDTRSRVRLFRDVCAAVRHAHRRGIIHRDLKPSNILVTEAGGTPHPRIIDFSIAKALGEPMVGTEYRTRVGQVIGTLEYMAPEQAEGRIDAVDTRTDVYALGAVLYELLAERLPLEVAGLPLHAAVKRIAEEPPRPLARTRAAATTATDASSRRVDSDLSTIALKCLEKDPDRRYGSAADLSEDVDRYLHSWPIAARPPSTVYQLRKLVGRHRVAFGVLALVFAFLVVFSVTVSIQLGIQRHERLRAEAETRKATSVRDFLVNMLTSARGEREGNDVTVLEALQIAEREVEASFADELDVGVAVRSAIASSYEGLESLERAEALRRRNVELLEKAYGPDDPRLGTALREVAAVLSRQARTPEAEITARRALAIHENAGPSYSLEAARDAGVLGLVLLDTSSFDESERLLRRQIEVLERAAAADPRLELEFAAARQSLVRFLTESGRPGDIEAIVRQVLDLKRRHEAARREPTLAVASSLVDLAGLLSPSEAEPLLREALDIQRRQASASPSIAAGTMIGLGRTLGEMGRFREAEPLMREALEVIRQAGPRTPDAIGAIMNLSYVLTWGGHPREGAALAHEAISIGTEVLPAGDFWITDMKMLKADAFGRLGRFDEGEALLREAVATADATLAPDHRQRTSSRVLLAMLLEKRGHPTDALAMVDQALGIYGRSPRGSVNRRVPYALQMRALLLDELGRRDEADPVHDEALKTTRSLLGERHFLVATILHDRARCLLETGRPGEAVGPARQALEIRRETLGDLHPDTAASFALMASIESGLGHPEVAREQAHAALKVFAQLDYATPSLVSEVRALAAEPPRSGS